MEQKGLGYGVIIADSHVQVGSGLVLPTFIRWSPHNPS